MIDETPPLTEGHLPTIREIEDTILVLLAKEKDIDVTRLIDEMGGRGGGLPTDSLSIIEVLVQIEAIFGVALPATAMTATVMRSVGELARHLHGLIMVSGRGDASV